MSSLDEEVQEHGKHVNLSKKQRKNLLKEIRMGNTDAMQSLYEAEPDFQWTSLYSERTTDSILHCACRLGLLNVIESLIATTITVDYRNKEDKTALHEAAQFSQYKACNMLLKHGAKVNALKRGDWTPLMLACTKPGEDSLKTVEVLLEHNAIVNYKNKDGWTAFHLVCRSGDLMIFKTLLKRHDLDLNQRTRNGRTFLHIAALHGNIEIVKILLEMQMDVNVKDACGNTPLHEAVLGNSMDACRLLVNYGSSFDIKNSRGFGLLHLAAIGGHMDVIKYLLTDLDFNVNEKTLDGFTALDCAERNNHTDIYKFLVSKGANKSIKDKSDKI